MADQAEVIAYPRPAYSWFVVAVLVFAALIAFIDRQVVAIVVDPMKQDLGVGDAQIGWLYGVFAVFYAVAAMPIAWLADRKSRTRLIAAGIFLWSLMTMACGLSRSFWYVFMARIGVGVGEATLTPATTSLMGDYFPRDQIPLALSVFQTGAIMGSGIAFIIGGYVLEIVEQANPLVLPLVGELHPWQQTFLYVGAPGILLAFFLLFLREPTRRSASGSVQEKQATVAEILDFYRRNARTLAFHHIGFLSFVLMGYAFVFWTVSFFVRVHGYEASEASQIFGWIFLVTGPIGPILAALFARWLSNRGRGDANIIAGMVGGLIAMPTIIIIQFVPSASWAIVLYVPAMIFINSPFGLAAGSLPVIAPANMRAQVAAFYMLVVSFGMMIGPPLAGAFNEYIFPGPEGVRYSLMTLSSIFGVIGGVSLWMGRSHYARSLAIADEELL
ncbi:MAG: MFS transporter [Gammaproteobacteria bacterium]|nr:MFS transporter [Gammaproteobacteria bacterium]